MFKNSFYALEANSFLSWHIGSVASFLREIIPVIESGDIHSSTAKIKEAVSLLASLDKAVADSVSLLAPSVASWILKIREHALYFLHPKISSLSKSRALFSPLDFHSLFDPELLKSFYEELKVQDVADLSRRVAMAVRAQPPPQPRPRFNLRQGQGTSKSRFTPSRRVMRPFRARGSRRPPYKKQK